MRGYLPDGILDSKSKIYAGKLAESALKIHEKDKILALMTNMSAAKMGYVNEAKLRSAYTEYVNGNSNYTSFWNAITLEAWLRRYFPQT